MSRQIRASELSLFQSLKEERSNVKTEAHKDIGDSKYKINNPLNQKQNKCPKPPGYEDLSLLVSRGESSWRVNGTSTAPCENGSLHADTLLETRAGERTTNVIPVPQYGTQNTGLPKASLGMSHYTGKGY